MTSATTIQIPQTRLAVHRRLLQRLPLHALTVLGGLVSAWALRHAPGLEAGQSSAADLLRYVPILVGLGANVGVQSSTILVRAFATNEVEARRMPRVIAAEVLVGALTGSLCGAACYFIAGNVEGATPEAWRLALSVALALQAGLTWAALVGCLVPLACRRIGIDPAVAAGPVLILLSDVGAGALLVLAAHAILRYA
jgi:magnesium transporter